MASLMMGVEGGSSALHSVVLAGLAGLVGGALSMVSCACCRGATGDVESCRGCCNVDLCISSLAGCEEDTSDGLLTVSGLLPMLSAPLEV